MDMRQDTTMRHGFLRSTPPRRYVMLAAVTAFLALWGAAALAALGDGIAYARDYDIWYIDNGTPIQLTDDAADDWQLTWSPDGTKVAFLSRARGTTTTECIWTVDVLSGVLTQMTDDDGTDLDPEWSTDGTKIAFASAGRDTSTTTCIWTVDVDTGILTRITDDGTVDDVASDSEPTWSPDGTTIAFRSDYRGAVWSQSIWTVDLNTGVLTPLTDDVANDQEPAWSPDGSQIAFQSVNRAPAATRCIWTVDIGTGALTQMTDDDGQDLYPTWSPDGTEVAFRSDSRGTSTTYCIWAKDLSLPLAEGYTQITDDQGVDMDPSWGTPVAHEPDLAAGNGIAYHRDGDLWYIDNGTAVQLTDGSAVDGQPSWSSDGTQIAFHSDSRGTSTTRCIWAVDVSSGVLTQITDDAGADESPTWSPDGTKIAFRSQSRGSTATWCLWTIDVSTGALTQITDDAAVDWVPSWSPDGTQIAFPSVSRGTTTTYCIWTADVSTGALGQITDDATEDFNPSWSSDGAKIAFASNSRAPSTSTALWTVEVGTGALSQITDDTAVQDVAPSWAPDGTKIAFLSIGRGASTTYSIWTRDLSALPSIGYTRVTDDLGIDGPPSWGVPAALGPVVEIAPPAVDVGVINVGSSEAATFTVTNSGAELLSVTDITSTNQQFTSAPTAFDVGVGLSQDVTVTFTPTVVGWETADFTLSHNGAGGTTIVAASGIGSVTPPTGDLLANTRIAISSSRDGDSEIYVMHSDGSDPTRLTTDAALDGHPSFSPNGSQIAFMSDRDLATAYDVFVMDADGLNATNLTNQAGFDGNPSWSPDGLKIAFQSDRTGDHEIHTMDPDGLNVFQVTSGSVLADAPHWPPDGAKLVYSDGLPGDIVVIRADGTDAMNLTNGAISGQNAAWSPDGTKIAFASNTGGDWEIYTIGADGASPTNLTNDAGADTMPYWSPDGTSIAFTSDRGGENQVYVMAAAGGAPTQLTTAPGVNDAAMWSAFLNLGDVTLTLPEAQGQIGSAVSVPIDITDVTPLAVVGIELTLTYDPTLLTPLDDGAGGTIAAVLGPVVPDTWSVQQNVPTPGELRIAMAGDFATPATGEGTVVTASFNVSATATAGATGPLILTQGRVNEGVISASTVDGTFTVLSLVYGDVTGNGDVSALDAAWVLEYVVNNAVGTTITFPIEDAGPTWAPAPLTAADALEVADVDNDAVILALDASEILRFLVGIIAAFPAEGGAAGAPSMRVMPAQYALTASATAHRPGALVTVSLDTSGVVELYAGELALEYDAHVLRLVKASVVSAGPTEDASAPSSRIARTRGKWPWRSRPRDPLRNGRPGSR